MAMINVRQRINVGEQGHVQAHIIEELGPTAKRPKAEVTHTLDKRIDPEEQGSKVWKPFKSEETMMEIHK